MPSYPPKHLFLWITLWISAPSGAFLAIIGQLATNFDKAEKILKKQRNFKVFAVMFCVTFCAVFAGYSFEMERIAKVSAQSGKIKVVLDAGHGGIDGGVVGVNGVKEATINLQITLILGKIMEERGYQVGYTRTGADAFSPFKKEDMKKRREIIRLFAPDAVISIHCNSYRAVPSRRGVQVFYDDVGRGKVFAQNLQNCFNENVNNFYSKRNYSALSGDYFITKCHAVPSVIIECGFLSNAEDEMLLTTTEYQTLIAQTVIKCLEENKF